MLLVRAADLDFTIDINRTASTLPFLCLTTIVQFGMLHQKSNTCAGERTRGSSGVTGSTTVSDTNVLTIDVCVQGVPVKTACT